MMAGARDVRLSDGGLVAVAPVRWREWRQVKHAFAALLGSRLLPEVLGLAARLDASPDKGEAATAVAAYLGERLTNGAADLAKLLAEAVQQGDELAELLIAGCTEGIDVSSLTAAEAMGLAAAAIEASDFAALLEREKNFWSAVIGAATAGLKGGPAPG